MSNKGRGLPKKRGRSVVILRHLCLMPLATKAAIEFFDCAWFVLTRLEGWQFNRETVVRCRSKQESSRTTRSIHT